MMQRKRIVTYSVSVLLVILSLLLVYAQLSDRKPAEVVVIIKSKDPTIEFWQVLIDGIHEAAKEFNADVSVTGAETETDVNGQIALMEQAIKRKPDAIVLAANDYHRLVPVAEKSVASGIKLIIVDSGINSANSKSMIWTDNVKAGREVGEAMQRQLSSPAKVAIISYVKGAASQLDREQGVRAALAESPGIELSDVFYVDGGADKALAMTKEILQKHPDLSGLIGLNEPTSVGAGKAIQELGLKNKVKLIGFDSSVDEIKLLDEGVMQATVIQRPFQMGYLSIKTAMGAIRGDKVPKLINTGSLVITKSNMYEEENQKLLFPFVNN